MKKRNKTVMILSVVLAMIVLASVVSIGVYLINNQMRETDYRQEIETAQKYLSEENYEAAIAAYTRAISRIPDSEEAYIGLSQVYEQTGDYESAVTALQDGFRATGSNRLYAMLSSLKGTVEANSAMETMEAGISTVEDEEVRTLQESDNLSWNIGMLERLKSYNYGDFTRDYGDGEISSEDGFLVVTHASAGLTCYYRNTENNDSIVDVVRGVPFTYGMPEKIQVDSLERIFNDFLGRISRERLKNFIGRELDYQEVDGRNTVSFEYQDCIFTLEADAGGNIAGFDIWNEIVLTNANKNVNKDMGNISGYVVDALNTPIAGVTMEFTNLTDRSVEVEDIKTESNGAFKAELPAGNYEIKVTASRIDEKYLDETYTLTVSKGCNYTGISIIVGIKSEGILRVVLEWGASPVDLDSYLMGTCGGQRVYVSYSNRVSTGTGFEGRLDVDVMSGYGPETITFEGDLSNADLTYTVVDFMQTGTLGQSGARVRIYWTDGTVQEVAVPTNARNFWTVFEITDGVLTIVNDVSDLPTRSTIKTG